MEAREALISCLLALALAQTSLATCSKQRPYFSAIFAFGDSLTDTGNYRLSQDPNLEQVQDFLPYGITFFDKPTGRFSDGRLVVDFIAEFLLAPLLRPFLSLSGASKRKSRFVNFAVAGATAESANFLKDSQNITAFTPFSLNVQIEWFECFLTVAKVQLSEALIFFGEIGGNDYNYAFLFGKSIEQVLSFVPKVIARIEESLKKLIKRGAKYIIVQGDMPMGCPPAYTEALSAFPKDKFGCIVAINEISQKHNKELQKAIHRLAMKYPHVRITYFDFHKAYTQVLKKPRFFGITNTTSPCYNAVKFVANPNIPFNSKARQEVKACPNPCNYISWDGVHLTEAMYKAVTMNFLGSFIRNAL